MSWVQEVGERCDLPSLSPRAGSTMKKSIKITAARPKTGVTRNPHCQLPINFAVSDPTIYPKPLRNKGREINQISQNKNSHMWCFLQSSTVLCNFLSISLQETIRGKWPLDIHLQLFFTKPTPKHLLLSTYLLTFLEVHWWKSTLYFVMCFYIWKNGWKSAGKMQKLKNMETSKNCTSHWN